MSVKKILVELDCLLDTRIATVSLINTKAAKKLLCRDYREREIDDYTTLTGGLVDTADVKYHYEKRNVETLKNSQCTGLVFLLKQIIDQLEKQQIDTPFTERVVVEVNTHPYRLSEGERDALVTAVMAYAGLETEVKTCSYSPEQLAPSLIRDEWDGVILYDFNSWFVLHQAELKEVKIPRNVMFVPALYRDKVPTEEDLAMEELNGMSPFEIMELSLVERLKLEMISPKYFSIVEV